MKNQPCLRWGKTRWALRFLLVKPNHPLRRFSTCSSWRSDPKWCNWCKYQRVRWIAMVAAVTECPVPIAEVKFHEAVEMADAALDWLLEHGFVERQL